MGRNVYLPGMRVGEGEELVPDMSAYKMLHHIDVEWPFLSFDIVGPAAEGEICLACGTQAGEKDANKIAFLRVSNISGEDGLEIKNSSVCVPSEVNRIRTTKGTDVFLAGAWLGDGTVRVYRCEGLFGRVPETAEALCVKSSDEGYGLCWSPDNATLIAGNKNGEIAMIDAGSGKKSTVAQNGSIEDIVWSPTEKDVFAVCSGAGNLTVWDMREKSAVLDEKIHGCDVNGIAWSRERSNVVASGADNGEVCVWDFRKISTENRIVHTWHKDSIVSLEWMRGEEAVLAVAGADDQATIWDFSIVEAEESETIPMHLMFVHQGQKELKELHWDLYHTDVLITSGANGINLLSHA
ncbi:MAG: ribosome assembly protein Rrb1 [Amphiamblys sp. WSBS2006]|nr:MAG: ribosome assembly protein Rrb1 [Amphiamblys sp. WSBS2006]